MSPPPRKSVSADEVRAATELLEAVVADRSVLTGVDEPTRKALLVAAGRVAKPIRHELQAFTKALRRERQQQRQHNDRQAKESTAIRVARQQAVFTAPQRVLPAGEATGPTLEKARHCYVCKVEYRTLHHFYDAMCPTCGDFNYAKRFQTAKLDGTYALITGARLKIGAQAALMLLRAGVHVLVSTRFPHDAAVRYANEPDYEVWKDRLEIHGLDLRHSPSVELFARWLSQRLPRLDFLINNAAQTVRRPVGFFSHLMNVEESPLAKLPERAQHLLLAREACLNDVRGHGSLGSGAGPDVTGLSAWHVGKQAGAGVVASAKLSQVRYTYDDAAYGLEAFPVGKLDADLQQVDLRTMNSWRMTLDEVSTPELLEVQLVNAVAPFILAGRLRGLMRSSPGVKHVVNVSAMEGSFSRGTKTDKHPHTNMAKAALNMMTLTSAPDYAKDGIVMNAVDTGWVTDEDPAQHAARKKDDLGFQPPLDIVDGAARVVDPIFTVANGAEPSFGRFLKDYRPTAW
ncbi:MAG: SDR family NAD(P)-dependent oxidoreductase [Archangium sp.]|nr:SDR family NAD(P)-dependent oxidoreductase [Archangium sp.]